MINSDELDQTRPPRRSACDWCKGDLLPLKMDTFERRILLSHGKRTHVCNGCHVFVSIEETAATA